MNRSADVLEVTIASLDDAVAWALEEMGERHGEGFHFVKAYGDGYEMGPDRLGYQLCLAPDAAPEHWFTALLGSYVDTKLLDGPASSNYSQWLFKGRAERPFAEALAADPAVVGYAATLDNARLDMRVWEEPELEEYMGRGGRGDPRVDAVALVDPSLGADALTDVSKRLQDALWRIERSSRLVVGKAGFNPYRDWVYATETPYRFLANRSDPPTRESVAGWVEARVGQSEADPWDGTGDEGDPCHGSTKPQIVWK